jgi:hypothetical protein
VTTDYYETEKGFGKDYVTKDKETLTINLEDMGFKAEVGDLRITILYDDVEIAKLSRRIKVSEGRVPKIKNVTINITVTPNASIIKLEKDIPDITMAKSSRYVLNLSEYFSSKYDIDYTVVEPDNISITVEGDRAEIVPDTEFIGTRASKIIAFAGNVSMESNMFNIIVSERNISLRTSKFARLGKPVKWKKNVKMDVPSKIIIQLPSSSRNITIKKIMGDLEEENAAKGAEVGVAAMTGKVTLEIELEREFFLIRFFKRIWRVITGRTMEEINETIVVQEELTEEVVEVIIEDNATEYDIEYETPAPTAKEERLGKGKKQITLKSELPYTDVIAYTFIQETKPENIRFSGPTYYEFVDNNNDSLIDEVDWIADTGEVAEIEIIKEEPNIVRRDAYSDTYEANGRAYTVYSIAQKNILVNETYVPITTAIDVYADYDATLHISDRTTTLELKPYYYVAGEKLYMDNISSYDILSHTHIYDNRAFYKYAFGIFNFSLLNSSRVGFEIIGNGNSGSVVKGNALIFRNIKIDFSDLAKDYTLELYPNYIEISGNLTSNLWLDPIVTYLPNATGSEGWQAGDTSMQNDLAWSAQTSLTSTQLDTISADDDNYVTGPSAEMVTGVQIRFNISEDTNDINNITVLFRGNTTDSDSEEHEFQIYLYNHSALAWEGPYMTWTGANNGTVNATITVISDFVNSSGDLYAFAGDGAGDGFPVAADIFYGEAKVDTMLLHQLLYYIIQTQLTVTCGMVQILLLHQIPLVLIIQNQKLLQMTEILPQYMLIQ